MNNLVNPPVSHYTSATKDKQKIIFNQKKKNNEAVHQNQLFDADQC